MTTSILGPIISRWQIELAALQTIELWLETYLSEVEREVFNTTTQIIPRPPEPALQSVDSAGKSSLLSTSIHGGLDLNTGSFDLMPAVIVNVQPTGTPIYFGSGDYVQDYELEIAAQVQGQDEDLARLYADLYGAALMALIVQNGTLGGIADRTRLIDAPRTELMDIENAADALQAQSLATFTVYISGAVNDREGIAAPMPGDTLGTPDPSQIPPAYPVVLTTNFTVDLVLDDDREHGIIAFPSASLLPGELYPGQN